MSVDTLEAPATEPLATSAEAAPDTSKPSGEATPASERNGQPEKTPKESRAESRAAAKESAARRRESRGEAAKPDAATGRDEAGRFTGGEKPAAVAAKPATPAADFDEATLARAESVGLTRHAAKKLGDVTKLAAEIARREAAVAAPKPQPIEQRKPAEPEVKSTIVEPKQAEADRLKALGDLGDEYGDLSPREKVLREEIMQLRETVQKHESMGERLARLEDTHRQGEQTRETELLRKDALELDAFVAELGDEFAPIFGKGSFDKIPEAYIPERDKIFRAARGLRESFPELQGVDLKKVYRGVAALFYSDEFNQLSERDILKRAKASAATRGAPPSTSIQAASTGHTGPSRTNPAIKERARQIRLREQGLA